ncbi:MAG: plastocyanin/azurin family copper-binding protein [Planctomycetota bacterium]|nr:plastocyanin/azurin family copper-binding protein [Planctomycetota bacterium]
MPRTARLPLFVASALSVSLATPALADRVTVYAFDFEYSINLPGEPIVDAVVNPGDIVTWVFLDDFHNTVSVPGQAEFWDSPIVQSGEIFEYQFTIPGVYWYYCTPHGQDNGDGTASGMAGTITVLPSPGSAAPALLALAGVARRGRRRNPEA